MWDVICLEPSMKTKSRFSLDWELYQKMLWEEAKLFLSFFSQGVLEMKSLPKNSFTDMSAVSSSEVVS